MDKSSATPYELSVRCPLCSNTDKARLQEWAVRDVRGGCYARSFGFRPASAVALALLGRIQPQAADQAEKLRKLKGYIRSNASGITNYARTDLFGSGAVEKAVDLLVSRRFKTRGMSWFRPGAAGMLALRLLRFNGQWDRHWQWRMPHYA